MKTIELTKGQAALVDDEDFDYLNQFSWYAFRSGKSPKWYVARKPHFCIYMHRDILQMGREDKRQVDHINGNRLDNRRTNLRICNGSENMANRPPQSNCVSGLKGVNFFRTGLKQPWRAEITVNKKNIHLGYYKTKEEAALAYDAAAKKFQGKFAYLNFP